MAEQGVDILVVGGGITGAGVALDAAARGYRVGLVERAADPADRRKVLVRVREDRIGPIVAAFTPLGKRMQALLARYGEAELKLLLDFTERSGAIVLERVAELQRE